MEWPYMQGKQKKLKKELEENRDTEEHKHISISEEKFREFAHKVSHLQSETMLREKVLLS